MYLIFRNYSVIFCITTKFCLGDILYTEPVQRSTIIPIGPPNIILPKNTGSKSLPNGTYTFLYPSFFRITVLFSFFFRSILQGVTPLFKPLTSTKIPSGSVLNAIFSVVPVIIVEQELHIPVINATKRHESIFICISFSKT